jgi:predicted component of type VI protein secretion system
VLHARLVTALSELGDHDAARRAAEPVARFTEHDTTDPSTAAQAWRVLARAAGKADALDDRIGYLLKALNAAALGADTSLRASLHTALREAVEAKLGVNASAIHSLFNHRPTPPPPSGHRDERPHDAAKGTAE